MRWLPVLAVVVVSAWMSPTTASGDTFGDWASDHGYSPGAVMPYTVNADDSSIDSLNGIGEYDWTTTPTMELNLSLNQLSSIEAGDFSELTNLEYLIFGNCSGGGNQISSIEAGAFSGLTNLTSLNLWNNQISSIEAGDFSGLTNLAELYLGGNQISSIEAGDFDGLTNLTELHLGSWCADGGNQISSIESGDFSELTNLEVLSLAFNQISSIESGDFSGLTNLTTLNLSHNQFSSVEAGDFSELTNLTTLDLHSNQISSIEAGDFDGLTNLTELDLWDNQLSSIEAGAFSGLSELEDLSLDNNRTLTELNLAEGDFSSLTKFDVGGTNITSVSLKNTVLNQDSLATLLDGGLGYGGGIGELDGVTEMDLSGIDFIDITELAPLFVMDDLIDLRLLNTQNMDAVGLDVLLDNLETIEGTGTEGVLYMTQADFDAFNTAGGGLLAAWNEEPGRHVEFVVPADLNMDGFVDGLDLGILLANFEQNGIPASGGELDGTPPVDGLDLGILLGAWNPPVRSPAATVPEPSTIMLVVGVAAIGLFARRGRRFV